MWVGQRQVLPGRGAERNIRCDSCHAVQPGSGATASEKATGFVRGSERIKEAIERGGAMGPGHGDKLDKHHYEPKNKESNLNKTESCLRRESGRLVRPVAWCRPCNRSRRLSFSSEACMRNAKPIEQTGRRSTFKKLSTSFVFGILVKSHQVKHLSHPGAKPVSVHAFQFRCRQVGGQVG